MSSPRRPTVVRPPSCLYETGLGDVLYCVCRVLTLPKEDKPPSRVKPQSLQSVCKMLPACDQYKRLVRRYRALSVSCVRYAVASVLPWKNDEGVQTLFSLNLASQCCLPVSVTDWLDRAQRYLISGLLLPPKYSCYSTSPGRLLAGFSLPVGTLSSHALFDID